MAEFFGDLERIAADLYPYRWPILAGVLITVGALIAFGYRKGWHMRIWRHRLAVGILGTPLLALMIYIGYDLGSPLFTSKTVEEEFPFSFSAIVPPDMDRSDVEEIMAGIAKFDQEEVKEAMPELISQEKSDTVDKAAAEEVAAKAAAEETAAEPTSGLVKLKGGNFRDQDSFHRGSGQATIYRVPDGSHLLRLEDLDVTNGPDLRVILTPHRNPNMKSDVHAPGYVELAKLKGNKGNQNYPIPDNVNIGAQRTVVIYCKPFSVIFSTAVLRDAS